MLQKDRLRIRGLRRPFRRRHSSREEIDVFAEQGGRRSLMFIYPNLFTSASLFLALFSMVKSSEGDFVTACWLIVLAAVCDALDGPVARLTHSASNFGLQYDSLADVVAFGVAPAFLMFSNLKTMDSTFLPVYAPKLALGASALFAICAAIRLARFNVQAETSEKHHFVGLPTPGAAATVVTAFLSVDWLARSSAVAYLFDTREVTLFLHRAILVLMIALSLLMVSEVHFAKLRHMIRLREKPINMLVIFVGIACMLIVFSEFVQLIFFGTCVVYIVSMIVSNPRHRRVSRREKPPADAPANA